MNALASDRFVLFASPLAGSEHDRIRVLLIAEAATETDVHRRLADDPWAHARRIVTTNVELWNLFVGISSSPRSLSARFQPPDELTLEDGGRPWRLGHRRGI